MLKIQQLTGGYTGEAILKNISFEVEKGELFGILGPNGSGKTTLLKMLSGVLPFSNGNILLKDKPLKQYSARELAKIIAVLPQHSSQAFSYTVKETVSLGRYAHQQGWFQTWSEMDEQIVRQVMGQTGVAQFENQDIQLLSGGERQRVFLAQALAQEPEILLLDEPTNHLDLSFQKDLLDRLKGWTNERNLTVISIFHDLNLAGLYCDRLLLMENGKINLDDLPNEVLREERIRAVYKTKIQKQSHPKVPAPQMVLLPEIKDNQTDDVSIDEALLQISGEYLALKSPIPLRTMSSGVVGSGTGWHKVFINRHVDKNYHCDDYRDDMVAFIKENDFEPGETVGMMTAVMIEDVDYQLLRDVDFSVLIVVTAGVGNAIDASRSMEHTFQLSPGTINTWVFVNGHLTEEAFIQSIMTATEAKTKALHELEVRDKVTGSIATGTSTDSISIAATQRGRHLEFAGTITPLGKLIGKGVYDCTIEAIKKSRQRVKI
ncbi:iron complex transport system ATP-binding protein [Mesobacillus persicus]|uniref:Iron complex transport system ATP-binding protein n=1 Tax=Mesobacillus persicus TaxID=930146 RepID=A0A1H7VLS4_9BACI|nr:adenosylcobinamide amidohydrolase [Mesobacillus persicus]SEM09849.1 iron complex transport system ATP-binding protein [Mesobacillus persicus]